MPLREYECPACGLLDERVIMGEAPAVFPCRRCQSEAALKLMPSRIALARSGMDNPPLDNLIGKDAEQKWAGLKERQEVRNSVRRETQSPGLSATGENTYVPISQEKLAVRTSVTKAVETSGWGDSA